MKHLIFTIVLFAVVLMSCEKEESVSPLVGQWKTTNLGSYTENFQELRYVMNISAVEKDNIVIESLQHRTSKDVRNYEIEKSYIKRSKDERFYDLIYINAIHESTGHKFKFTGKIENGKLKAIRNKSNYLTLILEEKKVKFQFIKK